MNMLATESVIAGGERRTVFRPFGCLELVGDFVFPHFCGLWIECLGTQGSFVEGRWVGFVDRKLCIQIEALKPGNDSAQIPHTSSEFDSLIQGGLI